MNINIIEKELGLQIDVLKTEIQPEYICIDDFEHRYLKDEIDAIEHQYNLSIENPSVYITEDPTGRCFRYIIYASELGLDVFEDLYTVTLIRGEAILDTSVGYSAASRYKLRYCLLMNTCNTCVDVHKHNKLINVMFIETMLAQAIELNRIDEIYTYYKDLLKLANGYQKTDGAVADCMNGHCNNGTCKV